MRRLCYQARSQNNPLIESDRNLRNELLVLDEDINLAEAAAAEVMQYRKDPETQRPLTILNQAELNGNPTRREVALLLQERYISSALAGQDVDAIYITAQSTNPGEAALLANIYAETFAEIAQSSSRAGVSASVAFLEEQVADLGDELIDKDASVETFMEREGAVALDDETADIVTQLGTLEAQRDAAVLETETKQATLAAVQEQLAELKARQVPIVGGTSGAELAAARTQLTAVQTQLETIYLRNPGLRGSDDLPPDVEVMERRKAALEQQVQRAAEQTVSSGATGDPTATAEQIRLLEGQVTDTRIRLQGLRAQRQQLNQRISELESELGRIPSQSIELAQLKRQQVAAEGLVLLTGDQALRGTCGGAERTRLRSRRPACVRP